MKSCYFHRPLYWILVYILDVAQAALAKYVLQIAIKRNIVSSQILTIECANFIQNFCEKKRNCQRRDEVSFNWWFLYRQKDYVSFSRLKCKFGFSPQKRKHVSHWLILLLLQYTSINITMCYLTKAQLSRCDSKKWKCAEAFVNV